MMSPEDMRELQLLRTIIETPIPKPKPKPNAEAHPIPVKLSRDEIFRLYMEDRNYGDSEVQCDPYTVMDTMRKENPEEYIDVRPKADAQEDDDPESYFGKRDAHSKEYREYFNQRR